MGMKLLLLETYCDCKNNEPMFCIYGKNNPGSHCFQNMCKHLGYANCPNELAYSDKNGLVTENICSIGFGGDMIPDNVTNEELEKCNEIWRQICLEKINEAYKEYMNKINEI